VLAQARDRFGERSVAGCSTGRPSACAQRFTGPAPTACPRPAGRSGCVYTATILVSGGVQRLERGTEKSGVPA